MSNYDSSNNLSNQHKTVTVSAATVCDHSVPSLCATSVLLILAVALTCSFDLGVSTGTAPPLLAAAAACTNHGSGTKTTVARAPQFFSQF